MLTIRELNPDTTTDFFNLFESVFFTEDKHSACYCTCWQMTPEEIRHEIEIPVINKEMTLREASRNVVERMIATEKLKGYITYLNKQPVAWCNVNDREKYKQLGVHKEFVRDLCGKTKSITCLKIAQICRHTGIGTFILQHVCNESAGEGYSCMEAYPNRKHVFSFEEYKNLLFMYEKAGFEQVCNWRNSCMYRKVLR